MNESHDLVIIKGKIGKYRNEIKRSKTEYLPDDIPIPISSIDGTEVYRTSNEKLFDHLCDIGFCMPLDEYEDFKYQHEIRYDNESGIECRFQGEKGGFLYNDFAEWLYKESGHYFVRIRQTDELYYYKDGIYVPHGETYIEEITQHEVGEYVKVSAQHVREITSYIKRLVLNEIDIIQIRSEKVACKNGIINLRTKELEPHSPDNYMFKIIPWNYNVDATCDLFDKLIDKLILNDLDKYKLDIMIGYPLINSYIYNKIFFMQGKPGTGKSTVANIIQYMYGDNVSNVALHDLIERPFMRGALIKSYANFSGDASNEPIKDASILKTLSGESRLDIDLKNVRMPIGLKNCSKLIIDTNDMPEFRLTDDAIFRRLIKVTFSVVIEESEKTSNHIDTYMIESEMEGLLYKAVNSAHVILTGDNPFKTTSIAESKEEYENARSNVVDKFINKHIQKYPDNIDEEYEIQSDVWKSFKDFAAGVGIEHEQLPKVRAFYKSFLVKCDIEEPINRHISEIGVTKKCYCGIRLVNC